MARSTPACSTLPLPPPTYRPERLTFGWRLSSIVAVHPSSHLHRLPHTYVYLPPDFIACHAVRTALRLARMARAVGDMTILRATTCRVAWYVWIGWTTYSFWALCMYTSLPVP